MSAWKKDDQHRLAKMIHGRINWADVYDSAMQAAEAILEAGWRPPPRIISTLEELDAQPPKTVVMTERGAVWESEKNSDTRRLTFTTELVWFVTGHEVEDDSTGVELPVTVLVEGAE